MVDERGEWKQIEISDDLGQIADLISVTETRRNLIAKHSN